MRHLDLFSGIGGFALAARWMGWETVAFCEIEPFCQAVLRHHWPGVPIHDDIRTMPTEPYAGVDILTGGFPCQDISCAGKGAGLGGERSGLWFDLLGVIRATGPRWLLVENVPALYHRGLDTVLGGLEEAGYECWAHVVGADDIGVPHRRERVWVVGRRTGVGQADPERGRLGQSHGQGWRTGAVPVADGGGVGLANPEGGIGCLTDSRNGGQVLTGRSTTGVGNTAGVRCERHPAVPGSQGKGTDGRGMCEPTRTGSHGVDLADASGIDGARGIGCGDRGGQPEGAAGDERTRPTEPGLGDAVDGLPRWVARWPARPGEDQYEWEAPRTGSRIPQRTAKLKALGNAIVPQVAYALFLAIEETLP